jgi:hypothetical protein
MNAQTCLILTRFLFACLLVVFTGSAAMGQGSNIAVGGAKQGQGGTQKITVGSGLDKQTFYCTITAGAADDANHDGNAAHKMATIIACINANLRDKDGRDTGIPSKYTATAGTGDHAGQINIRLNSNAQATPSVNFAVTTLEDERQVALGSSFGPTMISVAVNNPTGVLTGMDFLGNPGSISLLTDVGTFTEHTTAGMSEFAALSALAALANPILHGSFDATSGVYSYIANPDPGFATLAINDTGFTADFSSSTVVPEPSSVVLLGVGLAATLCWACLKLVPRPGPPFGGTAPKALIHV